MAISKGGGLKKDGTLLFFFYLKGILDLDIAMVKLS